MDSDVHMYKCVKLVALTWICVYLSVYLSLADQSLSFPSSIMPPIISAIHYDKKKLFIVSFVLKID